MEIDSAPITRCSKEHQKIGQQWFSYADSGEILPPFCRENKKMAHPIMNLFYWWTKDTTQGTPVIVKMENPNFSILEIDGPDAAFKPMDKSRLKNSKKVKWVLFLKANRDVGCVTSLGAIIWGLLGAIKKRLIFKKEVAFASEKLGNG